MKSNKQEFIDQTGLSPIGIELLNEVIAEAIADGGIKAKALRKKGTKRWYYHYNMEAGYYLSTQIEAFSDGDFSDLPADAELVDITIIINK